MTEPGGEQFGAALRRLRTAAGISQEVLAERAGLSARGISDLERGTRRVPRLATVQMLADALGLDDGARSELLLIGRSTSPGVSASHGRTSADPAAEARDAGRQRWGLDLPATPLIGRDREVADIAVTLMRSELRLMTLTGAGGAGKTRLSIEVGAVLAGDFANGVRVVPLAALTDAALVRSSIAEALGIQESGDIPMAATLIRYLRELRLLLILDNFEQVLDAAELVNDIVTQCPLVKVLVTSRVALRLRAEQIIDVSPLAVPPEDVRLKVDDIERFGAVALFVACARMARMDLLIDDETAATIGAICRRLDGLPLAIELAAARVRVLSPDELIAYMTRRLPILTGGARDLPLRHQALRNTVAWSDGLLNDDERQFFHRLAVFAGGWTPEAAAAVAGNPEYVHAPWFGLDQSTTLVQHSLVRRDARHASEVRFDMLETIREYALEQLASDGDETDVRERHAQHVLELVERQDLNLSFKDGPARLTRIDRDYDNARVALQWFNDRRDAVHLARLCVALRRYWAVRGQLSEGRQWLQTTLSINAEPSITRMRGLLAASSIACHRSDLTEAGSHAEEALGLSREFDDREGMAGALHLVALVAQLAGDYDRAVSVYEESAALKRQLHHPTLTMTLGNLAQVAFHRADTTRAIALFDECIDLDRADGNIESMGIVMTDLGLVMLEHGNDQRAYELFVEALDVHRDIGYVRMIVSTIEGIAAVHARGQRPERAARLYGAIEVICERIGYPRLSPDQWNYASFVDLTRAQMDPRAFAAAWAAGRELSISEAIDAALA